MSEQIAIAHFHLAGRHSRAELLGAATREFRNALEALPHDDEQRVRLYSGGFSKDFVAQICERRLGVESASVQDVNPTALTASS